MSSFYIMKAYHLTSSGRKLGLKKILRDEPNCTIVVATRYYSWNKSAQCFIVGSKGDYGVKAGDEATYTIDTGNGYKCGGSRLDIECVLQVTDGQIDGLEDGAHLDFGNRYTWVMK